MIIATMVNENRSRPLLLAWEVKRLKLEARMLLITKFHLHTHSIRAQKNGQRLVTKNTLQQRDFSIKLEHTSSSEFSLLLSFNVTQKSRISPTQSFSALNARPKKCKMKSCSLLLCGRLSLVVTGSRTLVLHEFNSFLVFRILFIFHCSCSFW